MTLVSVNSAGQAVVWLMKKNGYQVDIRRDGETFRATATHPSEPTQTAEGTDDYKVVCDLTTKCGMELDDG